MNTKPYYIYILDEIKTSSFTDKQLLPLKNETDSKFNVKEILNKKNQK